MTRNTFEYINYADSTAILYLIFWQEKIDEYVREFYGGNSENTLRTKFGYCVNKSLALLEAATDSPSMFRGVKSSNMLQVGSIIESRVKEIYLYEGEQQHLLLDILCSAPWNCLPQSVSETRKGAATWLIAEIIDEMTSPPNRMSGILKVAAIPAAIEFYRSIGFEENPDGSREMILTREKALQFLEAYRLRWS
ncbi:GNAT family N-acetyltransferase [Tolypothrix bouteillei VB521301_2]|uniref:N-acetyltransferase domain-containing protein n=1 Tax=Tolypothrix bouteillei VB521301 TaxID=1479485 RepID=A0A0C1R8K9_9CYAN